LELLVLVEVQTGAATPKRYNRQTAKMGLWLT